VERRTIFGGWLLPAALVLPQVAVTVVFFLLPAAEAVYSSVTATDAFGLHTRFVAAANFAALFADSGYLGSLVRTVVFCALVTALSMALGLVFAVFADREIRGRAIYRTLLMPTTFFLLIVNLVYAAFETFGTIMALTRGGPGQATETMVVKVYRDGVINLDLSGSAAQSVILMLLVIGLAALQFRFLGRRTVS
jgi:ABC-type sugar transport system permease subunit